MNTHRTPWATYNSNRALSQVRLAAETREMGERHEAQEAAHQANLDLLAELDPEFG